MYNVCFYSFFARLLMLIVFYQEQKCNEISFSTSRLMSEFRYSCFLAEANVSALRVKRRHEVAAQSADDHTRTFCGHVNKVVPVHTGTHASQLPPEFLHPFAAKKLVIGFECQGLVKFFCNQM
ncbi:3'-5' exonuclease domain-containing protein [Artemisia annua]|uniref:3'-5' exonuclease domain-containing protein n=1 Tax=Artemisia annua TaxID=35608 RepID=A0A2U1L355_ARTAN|nr:3'-5' exonuclease domain-containing protein [Artemisia annua]